MAASIIAFSSFTPTVLPVASLSQLLVFFFRRSRRATAGTRVQLTQLPQGSRVIDEVGELLGQLQEKEQVGAVRMAGLSADALDASVREVERAGLSVVAETEAAVEVGRLARVMVSRQPT